jgi:hypothetical protein
VGCGWWCLWSFEQSKGLVDFTKTAFVRHEELSLCLASVVTAIVTKSHSSSYMGICEARGCFLFQKNKKQKNKKTKLL